MTYEEMEARQARTDYQLEKQARIMDYIPEDEGTPQERANAARLIAARKADATGTAGKCAPLSAALA